MHLTPIARRSQPCAAPVPTYAAAPARALTAQQSVTQQAEVGVADPAAWTEQAPIDVLQSEAWIPEGNQATHLERRASVWDVTQDFLRELASSMREAYATFSRDGSVEATRLLTSHLAQLFVGTSAFFLFNMGRRLMAIWQRLRQLLTG